MRSPARLVWRMEGEGGGNPRLPIMAEKERLGNIAGAPEASGRKEES